MKPFKLPTLAAFKRLSPDARKAHFLAWVKTKRGRYDYEDNNGCPLAQFGAALGAKHVYAGSYGFIPDCPSSVMQTWYCSVYNHEDFVAVLSTKNMLSDEPWTFAALRKRLEKEVT